VAGEDPAPPASEYRLRLQSAATGLRIALVSPGMCPVYVPSEFAVTYLAIDFHRESVVVDVQRAKSSPRAGRNAEDPMHRASEMKLQSVARTKEIRSRSASSYTVIKVVYRILRSTLCLVLCPESAPIHSSISPRRLSPHLSSLQAARGELVDRSQFR